MCRRPPRLLHIFFVYYNDRVGLEILRKMSLFLPPKILFVRAFFIKCDFLR